MCVCVCVLQPWCMSISKNLEGKEQPSVQVLMFGHLTKRLLCVLIPVPSELTH